MRKTRRELNDYIIDEVLQTGTADIPASDLEIISAIAEEYVAEIFRRLREHGYDESTMKLYVCGGGGCLIKNFYHANLDRVKLRTVTKQIKRCMSVESTARRNEPMNR